MDVERDITVLVKTFERPDGAEAADRVVRALYPSVCRSSWSTTRPSRCESVPDEITTYLHEPYNSLGAAGGRNLGLRHVETPYVLVCDDDMVFERRTDLGRMLHALESTSFDVVSCVWLDFDPWKGICRGLRRFEGTLDVEDGVLVHRLGATRGTADGLPVFDVVHQFFVAALERLGQDPWDAELNLSEHYELFLALKERGLRSTRLPDVVVQHRQELPPGYQEVREDTRRYVDAWLAKRGLNRPASRRRAVPAERSPPLRAAGHGRLHGSPRGSRGAPRAVRANGSARRRLPACGSGCACSSFSSPWPACGGGGGDDGDAGISLSPTSGSPGSGCHRHSTLRQAAARRGVGVPVRVLVTHRLDRLAVEARPDQRPRPGHAGDVHGDVTCANRPDPVGEATFEVTPS